MTHAPPSAPRPVASLDEACDVLREGGGRASAARRAVVAVLLDADGPLSAEQVAAAAVPPLDVPATYRNLDRLESVGVVRHVHLGHGPGLYGLTSGTEREYALCDGCGAATVIDPRVLATLRDAVDAAIGLLPRFTHFPLIGRCKACRGGGGG